MGPIYSIKRQSFVPSGTNTPFPSPLFSSPFLLSSDSCLWLLFPALCPSGANKSHLCWELGLCPELILILFIIHIFPSTYMVASITLRKPILSFIVSTTDSHYSESYSSVPCGWFSRSFCETQLFYVLPESPILPAKYSHGFGMAAQESSHRSHSC